MDFIARHFMRRAKDARRAEEEALARAERNVEDDGANGGGGGGGAPRVVAHDRGGLGNRLKCLVTAWRRDARAKFRWEATPACDAPHMADLFAGGAAWEEDAEKDEVLYMQCTWRLELWPGDAVPEGFSRVREPYGTASDWRDIDFEYHRIPRAMLDVYRPLFAKLQPAPAIKQWVDAFAFRRPFDAGVHVRTWVDAPDRRERLFDLRAFVDAMRLLIAEAAGTRFFVCSDDQAAVAALRAEFGELRVCTLEPEPEFGGAARAWAEMLLLARAPVLVASHASTMSEVAWWLGGCRARVLVAAKGRALADHRPPAR
jgi:hypothetical protein